jgi:hypothetical protein
MPKVSNETAANVQDFATRYSTATRVNFVTIRQDSDLAPLFKGLPDDRRSCPHWGYVFKGSLTFTSDSGTEIFEAGDAFYAPPGHTPKAVAGSEFVQFSPTGRLEPVMAAMRQNIEAMRSG